ncbi:hypothetical protein Slala04_76060 [Streptomyces lavendulae subsp. lavendulae]|nr:hypothetical protein Slala04_76060 [Streptomyces lavendulae subsp. lavendulae]
MPIISPRCEGRNDHVLSHPDTRARPGLRPPRHGRAGTGRPAQWFDKQAQRRYLGNMVTIERAQTGLRIERNLLKVLKALAEYLDMPLGELVEGIVLHSFDGKAPFSAETLAKIEQLKDVYGLELTAADAHALEEK